MRLIDEEHIGAPSRDAERRHEQAEIERMQREMGDVRG
jgi:hypothetical protein